MVNSIQSPGRSLLCSDKYFIILPKSKNRRRRRETGAEKITPHRLLLCFVLESVGLNVFSAKFEGFASIIQVDGNAFFIKHLGLIMPAVFLCLFQ